MLAELAKPLTDALGGMQLTMVGSDGSFNAPAAAGLVKQGIQVATPGLEPSLTNKFALSTVDMVVGRDNALQPRPEPGMAPVVSEQRLQPMQRQFS